MPWAGGGDRQHPTLSGGHGAKTSHHMVDAVGGGHPLGEPLDLTIDRARPEKFGLQRRIALLEHFCSTSHLLTAQYRIDHLGAVDHVVDQICHRVQVATTAANRCQQFEVVARPQQLPEP
jgi:hypothetical protein